MVTLRGETKWLLLLSSGTVLLKLLEFNFRNGLEMAGHSAFTLGESAQSLFIHVMVLKCNSLCAA